jgi:hypothetical protein
LKSYTAAGALAPVELDNYRYLVMVSINHLNIDEILVPPIEHGVTYRVLNVACSPKTPILWFTNY